MAVDRRQEYRTWREASVRAAQTDAQEKQVYQTVWETYVELADNAYRSGHEDIAAMMLKAALKEARQLEGESFSLAELLTHLGKVYQEQQRYKKAEVLYKRSLETCESSFGKWDTRLCEPIERLGNACMLQGNYDQAERLFQRSLSIAKKGFGSRDPKILPKMLNLIHLYTTTGQYEKAEPLTGRLKEMEAVSQVLVPVNPVSCPL